MANSLPFSGAAGSRLVQRLRRRYDQHLHLLAPGAPSPDTLAQCFQGLLAHYPDTGEALRVLRQLCLERLVVLDCEQHATLEVVTHAMTWLAEFTLDQALREATGGMFVVVETQLKYHRPAQLDDLLTVNASLLSKGRSSLVITQQAWRYADTPVLLCEGTIRIGWVQAANLKPDRIPPSILERLI